MTERMDTAEYLEELAAALASHGSNIAALRMAELEQKVSPYLAAPGVPSATAGSGGSLAGVDTAYAPTVAMGAAGLFVTDGAITVTNAGSVVIIDGTSNMFKIQASGTKTQDWPATWGSAASGVTVTGAAPGGVFPAVIGMLRNGRTPDVRFTYFLDWDATTGPISQTGRWYFNLSGTDDLGISLQVVVSQAATGSMNGMTAALRYYVLKEAGI